MPGKGIPRLAVSYEHWALGRAVRETRVRRGMTQEELALMTGLHRNQIGALERGEQNATFSTVLRTQDGLRVALSELIAVYERQLADAG
jgi:transcriptional regulator with XRE-family HTH domain